MTKRKVRLCYVLPHFDPATSTHFLHLYELLQRVAKRVDLCLIYGADADERPEIDGVAVAVKSGSRWLRGLKYIAALTLAYVQGYRTVYVHYHALSALWASLLCRVFGGQAYVWCCVKHERYFTPWSWRWRELQRKLLNDVPICLMYRWAQRIVACSSYMAAHIVRTFAVPAERVLVFENWVNVERYRPLPEKRALMRSSYRLAIDAPIIFFAHTLGKHKGAHHLPELARRVLAGCPEVHFLIAGDGPYKAELKEHIRASGLQERVRLLGPVANRDLPEVFAAADVFINPACVEEFGRVLLEAMACGVPFVSTDGGGGVLAFTTPHQQEYVTAPDDVPAFAERVVTLLRSPEERRLLAEEGLAHVRSYSLEVATERFIELLERG